MEDPDSPDWLEAAKEVPLTVSLGPMGSLLRQLHSPDCDDEIQIQGLREEVDGLCVSLMKLVLAELGEPSFTAKWWIKEAREILYDTDDFITDPMRPEEYSSQLMLRVRGVSERRQSFPLVPAAVLTSIQPVLSLQRPPVPSLDTAAVLDKKLVNLLAFDDEGKKQLKVVPIFGVAGVGKTRAAAGLYREFGGEFQCRAFLRVSRNPDMRRLLTNLLSQIQAPPVDAFTHVQRLIDSVKKHLQGKRFFVIIDDLWTTSVWYIIRRAFPDGDCRSRIITTTQMEDVALACCSYEHYIFKMGLLNRYQSRNLLFNRLYRSEGECPPDLEKDLDGIINKCGGLPLAIVTIASLLASEASTEHIQDFLSSISRINPTFEGMKEIFSASVCSSEVVSPRDFKKISSPAIVKTSLGMKEIMNLIYSKLPSHLKTYLLYLSMYPEDYTIKKDDFGKQCVAEGFLSGGEKTPRSELEETAGAYFDELVRRGMIQPLNANPNGGGEVLSYKVGHVVLDFIRRRSMEENFITVVDYLQATPELVHGKVRRLSIQSWGAKRARIPASWRTSKLRSLVFCGLLKCVPSVVDYKLLRVLVLHIWADEKSSIFKLTRIAVLCWLRYLKIKCNIKVHLPDKIGQLKHLETLEVPATVGSIPPDIGGLLKLCTLKISVSKLSSEDIDILKGLPALSALSLSVQTELAQRIVFETEGFQELKYFKFMCIAPIIFFKEGAMRNVRKFKLGFNANYTMHPYFLPDAFLQHLTGIQEITAKIGGAEANILNAEDAFRAASSTIPGSPTIRVQRVDCNFYGEDGKTRALEKQQGVEERTKQDQKQLALEKQQGVEERTKQDQKQLALKKQQGVEEKTTKRTHNIGMGPLGMNMGTSSNSIAEAVVSIVLQKIAAALGQEALDTIRKKASALLEVDKNMRQLEIEFTVMKAFLMQAAIHPPHRSVYDVWLGQVKKVSHDAEDIIDEYAYLIGQTIVHKLFRHLKNISVRQSINKQLKQIEVRLLKLISMKDSFGIAISGEGEVSYPIQNSQQEHALDTVCVDDNIVGMEEESAWLVQQLIHGQEERTIISVCGMGGLGKTTLLRWVYNKKEIKQKFNCFAWVSVSQIYNIAHLLREILRQLLEKENDIDPPFQKKNDIDPRQFDSMGTASLVEKLANYLQDKRYLIVLDDLWSRDAWVLLDHALARSNNGSRIIITTRIGDVASLADDEHCRPLKTLGEKESWDLFCKKAFPRLKGKPCPESLIHWAKKIVDKCEGLPLAIVAMGSLLSRKRLYENEWKSFYNQLHWQIVNNPELSSVRNALDLSINYLPGYLKNCFLYCGIFPEDRVITRYELIPLWIAEGFVEGRETRPSITMEEVADEYLNEIVQLSLLQVVEMDAYGRANKFQMHDLVRDIVVSKCTSGGFSLLLDDPRDTAFSSQARRVSVLKADSIKNPLNGGQKIRSFILFDHGVSPSWVDTATGNFKLLTVLSLRFAKIKKLPDVVTTLFNLHYLDLSYTNLKVISKALCNLTKLQMLDLDGTGVVELPVEVKRLTKLRYLRTCVYHDFDGRIFDCFQAAKVHCAIHCLNDLQELGYIEANEDLVVNLANLTSLRIISIMKVKRGHIKELWTSVTRMPHLLYLTIMSYAEEEVLDLEYLGPLPNLEYFYLKGKLEGDVIPTIFRGFKKLRDLRMGWSRMQVDPIPSFAHMVNLVQLHLYRVYEGEMMTFREGWFPKLEKLHLADMEQLSWIEMEAGTMRILNYVKLIGLRSMLHVPLGFQHLTSLQEMVLQDMPAEFISRLRGPDSFYIKHIPTIYCRDS